MKATERQPDAYTVLFDGDCPLCIAAVKRLRTWDSDGRLSFVAGGSEEANRRFPGISMEALAEALHLVGPDGDVWVGAEAVEELVGLLPRWRRTQWVFKLPFARPVADWVYRRIAANRRRLLCDEHCA